MGSDVHSEDLMEGCAPLMPGDRFTGQWDWAPRDSEPDAGSRQPSRRGVGEPEGSHRGPGCLTLGDENLNSAGAPVGE